MSLISLLSLIPSRWSRRALSVALLALSAPALAAPAAPAPAPAPSPFAGLEVIEERLPNGLTLIMSPDRRLPTVAVEVRYLVGSAHEREGRSGFAHLFEHLMFQGSRSFDREYFEPFAPLGADINGTTNTDRTNYYEQVPAEALELALWMESDRMEGLLDALTQEKLDNQRDVVKNERRQRYENTPYGMAWRLLFEEMFPVGHPYQHTTIGSHEDLSAATLDDVRAFFRQYYAPSNALLTLVGDFEPDEARALVARYFGRMPAGELAPTPRAAQPTAKPARLITVEDKVKLPRVYLAWHSPALYAPGDAALDLLATLLSDGKTSRLYQPLVYEQKVAKDVAAFQMSMGLSSLFVVYATAAPGQTAEELERALMGALARALAAPPTDDEHARALNAWRKSFYHRVEGAMSRAQMLNAWRKSFYHRVEGAMSRAQMLSAYLHHMGVSDGFEADLARYTALTPADVHAAAAGWIHDAPLRLRFVPEGAAPAPAPDRQALPALPAPAAWAPPAVDVWRAANGLTVWHVEQRQAPLVSLSLVLPTGADADPAEKAGLTALTVDLLDEGAGARDALALSDALQRLATDYGAAVTSQSTTLSLNALAEHLPASLDLLADVLTRPRLSAEDFERVRQQRAAQAVAREADPAATRGVLLRRVLFGEGLQGLPAEGAEETLARVTLDDVRAQHAAVARPEGATLIAVGGGRHRPRRPRRARGRAPRRLARRAERPPPPPHPRRRRPRRPLGGLPRQQPVRHRRGARRAQRGGRRRALRRGALQPRPRRRVHQPRQHEPARGEGLHLRRLQRPDALVARGAVVPRGDGEGRHHRRQPPRGLRRARRRARRPPRDRRGARARPRRPPQGPAEPL